MDDPNKKNRKYSESDLKSAVECVLSSTMTIYRASKEYKIPWSTLKENVSKYKTLRKSNQGAQIVMAKVGRPFALPAELEQKLLAYIIEMQEIGFGLSVTKVKQIALSLAKAANVSYPFNDVKGSAGWNWWVKYKERYGLSLRTPENLSAGRAMCSNPIVLDYFYEKLEKQLLEHSISPDRLWNCDETGLMFVNKPGKIVTSVGKKYVYNRTYAEKGTTTTLLACVNAAGCFIPPFIIFKGIRVVPQLTRGFMPNTQVRFSPKGWINGDLFLDWIKFFAQCIPPGRPVLLIMDSHASHVVPPVLEYARSQQIILFTIPSHTSAILQPLDISIHRPLKVAWRNEIETYKMKTPCAVPTRYDFHIFFTPAFEKSFTPSNIRAGFEKAGIYPFNRTAVNRLALAPSKLTDKPFPEPTEEVSLHENGQTEQNSASRIRIVEEVVYCNIAQENRSQMIDDPVCDPLHSAGLQSDVPPNQPEGDNILSDDDDLTHMDQIKVPSIQNEQNFMTKLVTADFGKYNHKEKEISKLRKIRIPTKRSSNEISHNNEIIPTTPVLDIPNSSIQHHPEVITQISSNQEVSFHKDKQTEQNITPRIRILEEIIIPAIAPDSQIGSDVFAAVLKVPQWEQNQAKMRSKRTLPHARCLTPIIKTVTKNMDDVVVPGTSGTKRVKTTERRVKLGKKENKYNATLPTNQRLKKNNNIKDDDWICDTCKGWYSKDAASKNGADWISCSFCLKTYHVYCQSQEFEADVAVFKCDMCCVEEEY